jgi:hypothetical protein
MWTPNNISEWLDERIGFIEKIISYSEKNQVSTFIIDLENFKYCKKLYTQLIENSDDCDIKKRFSNVASKLIFDAVYELDKQEYKCIIVHGVCLPTKEKDILPQENIDNITEIRLALEKIFYQIQELSHKI